MWGYTFGRPGHKGIMGSDRYPTRAEAQQACDEEAATWLSQGTHDVVEVRDGVWHIAPRTDPTDVFELSVKKEGVLV